MTKPNENNHHDSKTSGRGQTSGIFSSLTGFLENLENLAQTGESLSRKAASQGVGRAEERFSNILSGLTEIAEKLRSVSRTGEFTFPTREGGIKGVYGFSLKTAMDGRGEDLQVEPFGNIRKDVRTGQVVVQEVHEPLLDVFEDETGTTLVAEMPGIGEHDLQLDFRDDVITLHADKKPKKYAKEILLRHTANRERTQVVCNNGIVTIRCNKPI